MKAIAIIAAISASACRPIRHASPHDGASPQCTERETRHAEELVRQFEETVATQPADATGHRSTNQIATILSNRCFAFATENPRRPVFELGADAKSWWERGGRAWLKSFLRPPSRWVLVPPDVIPPIETQHLGGASELECALTDNECGLETAGWVLRADEMWTADSDQSLDNALKCNSASDRLPNTDPYRSWRSCIEARRSRRPTLPIGRIRAPTHGWVVLQAPSNERGRPCVDLDVFSLETGASYVLRSCAARGRAAASRTTVVGFTSLDAVREALWMSILAPQVQVLQPEGEAHALPKDIARTAIRPIDNVVYFDSAQSSQVRAHLQSSWIVDGKVIGGDLAPRAAGRPGDAYAELLWRVARASLREGCPPQKLPANLTTVDQNVLAELSTSAKNVCPTD
jgi:hypothetical protein